MTSAPRRDPVMQPFARPTFVGLMLFSFVLRGPFVVVSTVTTELSGSLGMSATTIGLLTSLPVLCFGLATPGASKIVGRLGVERSILLASAGVLIGVLVRSAGGVEALFAGTVLLGLAITVGNVVCPLLIGRDFRDRTATVTGTYTAALNVGSMITLTATGPLVSAWGWRAALVTWAVLPAVAFAMWTWLARRRRTLERLPSVVVAPELRSSPQQTRPAAAGAPIAAAPRAASLSAVLRRPSTWMLTVAFAGQAFAYYGITAWLPTLLADEQGMTRQQAGAASSIFQICALIGAIGSPVVINHFGLVPALLINGALWLSLPVGMLVTSDLWPIWNVTGGIAQGGTFVCVFTAVVLRSRTLSENRRLSSVVQTGGYTVACLGPVVIGSLHELSGAWRAPLLAAVIALTLLLVLGSLASRGLSPTRRP